MAVLLNGTNGLIQAYDYQVLTTGFSYTFAAGTQTLVINPAGTLAAGTITMPAAPSDGMTITFSSTKQITAVTLNGNTGQTVVGGVSYLPANTSVAYVYRSANTSWFPVQAVPLLTDQPLGVGQTWQSFTVGTQRVLGTTYTNSTGRPIFVVVQMAANGSWSGSLIIDGIYIGQAYFISGGGTMTMYGVVPSGSTYSAASGTLSGWVELR